LAEFKEMAEDFLSQKNLAVVGVSRNGKAAANMIYKTLRDKGYQVYPINPQAETVEGDRCYPELKSLPSKPDGVFMMTRPEVTLQVVQECIDLGVRRVWMHENAFAGAANSSVSKEAVEMCQAYQMEVIAGGCPMMFLEFGHKCMRWILGAMGKLPA
jgi:predicted CoA-binding protein